MIVTLDFTHRTVSFDKFNFSDLYELQRMLDWPSSDWKYVKEAEMPTIGTYSIDGVESLMTLPISGEVCEEI